MISMVEIIIRVILYVHTFEYTIAYTDNVLLYDWVKINIK